MDDKYASIRKLPASFFTRQAQQAGYWPGDSSWQEWIDTWPEQWTNAPSADFNGLLAPGGWQSKYNEVQHIDDKTLALILQQPGAHKYDTMQAIYGLGDDGSWSLQNDPMTAPTRQVSTGESMYRDPLEQFGKDFVLPSAAMYFGGQALMGGAGGAGASAAEAAGGGFGTFGGTPALEAGFAIPEFGGVAGFGGAPSGAGFGSFGSLGGLEAGFSIPEFTGGGLLSTAAPSGAGAAGPGGFGTFGSSAPLEAGFSIPSFDAAGAGGSTLFGNSQLGQAANGLLDYAKSNPKLIGGLLGGLTGATGGLDSGGGGAAPYTGPMPTIERGGWKPRVQAQQMAVPTFGAGLKTAQGNANSGLWRYNKGG